MSNQHTYWFQAVSIPFNKLHQSSRHRCKSCLLEYLVMFPDFCKRAINYEYSQVVERARRSTPLIEPALSGNGDDTISSDSLN
jgi:hypothetical protein